MRTIRVSLAWPDGTAAAATLNLVAPELGAGVDWKGDEARIAALPAEIAPALGGQFCSIDSLLTHGDLYADSTGGQFEWESDGAYEIWAE